MPVLEESLRFMPIIKAGGVDGRGEEEEEEEEEEEKKRREGVEMMEGWHN
jgi:hypothetical protein